MSRWLRGRLPCELRSLVGRHAAAMEVQRVARGAMVRRALSWTRRAEWAALRSALREVGLDGDDGGDDDDGGRRGNIVAELASCSSVTLEWRTEPGSWLATLRSPGGAETVREILGEVRRGEWGVETTSF